MIGRHGDAYLGGHGDERFGVESYDLQLDYSVASNRLDGRAELVVRTLTSTDRLDLDLRGLDVQRVTVDGRRPAKHSHHRGRLRIALAEAVPDQTVLRVGVRYGGSPRPLRSAWGEVGFEELDDGVIVAGQPVGAPSWFPCNDRPDDKAVYRVQVTVEAAYAVVANGAPTGRRRGASTTTWTFAPTDPMATYLATLQIGRYTSVDLPDGGGVPQRLVAPASRQGAAARDVARQHDMLAVFAELFGPYPFDTYTVVVTDDELEIPLEAQGLSVFGSNHLDGTGGLERLVAHELAHQWFGNSLTVRSWHDIWLHEGFACYAEWLWSERSGGRSAAEHARTHHAALAALPADLVLADPGPDLMFDDRLYKRGALALQAIRTTCGDDVFFDVLRSWTALHRHGGVSTELFTEHLRGHCPEAAELLTAWLHHAPLPALP
ncbi:M1 family metallopeptidase [Angustibacter aerolatus]